MKSKSVALIVLLSVGLFGYSQDHIVELPLTPQIGYGPFNVSIRRFLPYYENNPLKVSKIPEGLTDVRYGYIETNIYQSFYPKYLLDNIAEEDWHEYTNEYEQVEESWDDWIQDTVNLSKTPVKTKIAYVCGKDSNGIVKFAVDANSNLDLSDDALFTPLDTDTFWSKTDSFAQIYAVDVSFETFVHNKITPVHVPLLIVMNDEFWYNIPRYATTRFKERQIAVSSKSFADLSYHEIELALVPDNLTKGEKVYRKDLYRKNEYIEIEDEIYKIAGVNTNKNTLVLEKTDLPKSQLFSTQTGYKLYPFEGEDLTTETTVSPEDLKGKYVLLDFWAEWWQPSIQEFPHLKELYAKTDRAKFEIVGIAGNTSFDNVKKLIEQHELTWIQIFSDDHKIFDTYGGINGVPTTILLDTEGIIVARDLRGKELEDTILSLIKE